MLTVQTSDQWRPEKEYAFHVLFEEMLGVPYRLEFQAMDGHVLRLPNASALHFDDWFSGMSDVGEHYWANQFSQSGILGDFKCRPETHPLPDLFAAAFFMLSRWEEAHSKAARDKHGRFPASQSLAVKLGFLHRPVVNEWADWLWAELVRLGWQGTRKQRSFKISLSCDVDHPRLWWSKMAKWKTLFAALVKRGNLKEARFWLQGGFSYQHDPYDVFDEWMGLLSKYGLQAQFNFMGERPSTSDCWYPLRHPFVSAIMKKIAANGHQIGFHPGYEAFEDVEAFRRELASLQELSPQLIKAGRQHYLRFSVPDTWQCWESAGLKEDSTLGYPEAEGFRCGICQDYPVYDIQQRKMLQLREKPLIAMDVTLAFYQGYTPEVAKEKISELRREVEKHQGDFTILWHNSSWNTLYWKAWNQVLIDTLKR